MVSSKREQWAVAEVAAHLGVRPKTITAYVARGQMPAASALMVV